MEDMEIMEMEADNSEGIEPECETTELATCDSASPDKGDVTGLVIFGAAAAGVGILAWEKVLKPAGRFVRTKVGEAIEAHKAKKAEKEAQKAAKDKPEVVEGEIIIEN